MARGRARRGRPQTTTTLPAWPLDPPPVATPPTATHGPTATAPTVGAYIPTPAHGPGPRTFFCKQCRRGVQATDPPDGWLRVQLHDAGQQRRDGRTYVTAALLCGLPCLRAWATSMTEITP